MTKTTVLIADDQPLIRDGLEVILKMENDFQVIAKTSDGLSTVSQVKALHPDLILMDIHMPKLDGLKATKQIKAVFPEIKILILTTFDNEDYIWEAIVNGASGYIIKGEETTKILATVRACVEGRINFPSSIHARMLQTLNASELSKAQTSAKKLFSTFTIQERNILHLLKQGKTNQMIASELLLSEGTVKNYLSDIYKKLNVSNKSEAIVYIHKNNL